VQTSPGIDIPSRAGSLMAAPPGQHGEWAELADEVASRLAQIVWRLAPSGSDVEDLVSEALARTFASWERVPADARAAWATRVAVNLAYEQGRRAQRRHRHPQTGAVRVEIPFDETVVSRDELRAALAQLSQRQSEVVLLRYVADLPIEEVARVTGLSPGTVRTHADRGIGALRRLLGIDRSGETDADT
jgi:RNA polymerase sigma factor (sigma-70 family)